jgi:hypothetical protein
MPTRERVPFPRAIVAGVDGSASSLAAIDLAVREAVLRRRPLRLVHAFAWPNMRVPLDPTPYGPPEGGLRHQAERILAEAYARAHAAAADLEIDGELITGRPLRFCSTPPAPRTSSLSVTADWAGSAACSSAPSRCRSSHTPPAR